jgi:pimeloyl-ACP methyl ester carboxylesterase
MRELCISRTVFIYLAAIIFISFLSCAKKKEESAAASPISRYVAILPDVTLEVVDWGGKGIPLVFLAGLGHTAHVFDEFAPRFIDEYRALGITRRGFGSSSQPATGYSVDSLANDISIVLDSLQLEEVILVGHSLGGDEMTRLASLQNDRLKALIYIDAAYAQKMTRDSLNDYPLPEIPWPEPTEEELRSPEAYRLFYERANGVRMPLGEIRAMYNWDEDGSFGGGKTSGRIYSEISGSLRDQAYTGISLPALAVYGVEYPIEELFMDFDKADSSDQEQMIAYYEAGRRLAAVSRRRFRDQMERGTAIEIQGAGHSLYITHPDRVEKEMRKFLQNIQ